MSDLYDALDQIRARLDARVYAIVHEDEEARRITTIESQADVPRLVAAVEAVLKEAADADNQDRLISPNILRKRLTDALEGEGDE